MTRDDIIRIARESGLLPDESVFGYGQEVAELARFAALVAAAEREACAKACDATEEALWQTWDSGADPLDQGGAIAAAHLAAAIRARGQA